MKSIRAPNILSLFVLRDEVVDDVAVDVGEAVIPAGVAVGELLVVEAHEVEDRGIHVVDVDAVLDGREPELVGGAVAKTFLHPAAGHPGGVAVVVVVATLLALGGRGAAKFAAPDDE